MDSQIRRIAKRIASRLGYCLVIILLSKESFEICTGYLYTVSPIYFLLLNLNKIRGLCIK